MEEFKYKISVKWFFTARDTSTDILNPQLDNLFGKDNWKRDLSKTDLFTSDFEFRTEDDLALFKLIYL